MKALSILQMLNKIWRTNCQITGPSQAYIHQILWQHWPKLISSVKMKTENQEHLCKDSWYGTEPGNSVTHNDLGIFHQKSLIYLMHQRQSSVIFFWVYVIVVIPPFLNSCCSSSGRWTVWFLWYIWKHILNKILRLLRK